MSDTVFTSQQTPITAGWANDVNKAVYYSPAYVVGGGTGAAYVAALNAVPSAITDKALLWMYAPATNTAGATLQLVNGPSPGTPHSRSHRGLRRGRRCHRSGRAGAPGLLSGDKHLGNRPYNVKVKP